MTKSDLQSSCVQFKINSFCFVTFCNMSSCPFWILLAGESANFFNALKDFVLGTWTNTFCNLSKYIFKLREKHFKTLTNALTAANFGFTWAGESANFLRCFLGCPWSQSHKSATVTFLNLSNAGVWPSNWMHYFRKSSVKILEQYI